MVVLQAALSGNDRDQALPIRSVELLHLGGGTRSGAAMLDRWDLRGRTRLETLGAEKTGGIEKTGAENANGAGIAADPTLTCAWPSEEGLGGRCSVSRSRPIQRSGRSFTFSPVLAPASGSFQFQVRSEDLSLHFSVPRPFNPWWPSLSSGFAIAEALAIPSILDRIDQPIVTLLSRSDHQFSQLRAETLCEKPSWPAWTDIAMPDRFKFSTDFRSLNRLSEKLSRLSDELRLLPIAESGKLLIHCKLIQRWTEVDNSTIRRRIYRSRCASNLRRRALSLMKPSASFWS
jgi:hypothetical protein